MKKDRLSLKENNLEKLKLSQKEWEDGKKSERLKEFTTISSKNIRRLYSPVDLEDAEKKSELGEPGHYPFTRGAYETMYRTRFWTMRQFAGFGTAEDTNERFHYLLNQGQTGLSTAFDFPTLMGLDSDDPRSLGEVGVCGVAIDNLKDMETLFKGIPLEKVTTSMTINGPASIMLPCILKWPLSKGPIKRSWVGPFKTMYSRISLRRRPGFFRKNQRCVYPAM